MHENWRQPVATGIPNVAGERKESNRVNKEGQVKRRNGEGKKGSKIEKRKEESYARWKV
jgi:hypothetical protein